jgi:hypothetical protein
MALKMSPTGLGRVASLDGAKAEFEASWKQRKAWADGREVE